MPVRMAKVSLSYLLCRYVCPKLFTELREYALTIHCKSSCGMCKSLPAYGSKTETDGPSATLIIKELVHAATIHTDATVLRSGFGGCGACEFGTASLFRAVKFVLSQEDVCVISCRVVTDANDSGEENMMS